MLSNEMVAGHLQIKKGYYYMVLTFNLDGKPSSKWKATGLKVKGNKKRAEAMLLDFRMSFTFEQKNYDEVIKNNIKIPTVEEYINDYIKSIEFSTAGRNSWERQKILANHIIKKLGKYKVTELTKGIIKEFLYGFAATPYNRNKKGEKAYYAQDTINKVSDLLKNIINELLDDEYIEKDIMSKVKRPKTRKIPQRKNEALSKEEIVEVFSMAKDDLMLTTILHMLLLLGIRPGELWALERTDIDWDSKLIHIYKALSTEPTYDLDGNKTGKKVIIKRLKNDNGENFAVRTLTLTPLVEHHLSKWLEHIDGDINSRRLRKLNNTSSYLFCNAKNGELAEPQYYLRRYKYLLKKHGRMYNEFNYYRFRHTFATNALRQGLDIKSVQMLLGDNDPEMVLRIYTNMNKKEILEAHQRFTKQYEAELLEATG